MHEPNPIDEPNAACVVSHGILNVLRGNFAQCALATYVGELSSKSGKPMETRGLLSHLLHLEYALHSKCGEIRKKSNGLDGCHRGNGLIDGIID